MGFVDPQPGCPTGGWPFPVVHVDLIVEIHGVTARAKAAHKGRRWEVVVGQNDQNQPKVSLTFYIYIYICIFVYCVCVLSRALTSSDL